METNTAATHRIAFHWITTEGPTRKYNIVSESMTIKAGKARAKSLAKRTGVEVSMKLGDWTVMRLRSDGSAY